MLRRLASALAVATLLVAWHGSAWAAQLDARDRPKASGPLTFEGKSCGKDTIRSGGRIVAVSRFCIFLYGFSPTAELDPLRDYGAAWAQTELDPRSGWCATRARSSVFLPEGAEGHASAPKGQSTSAPKRIVTKLALDGQGLAVQAGVIRQGWRLHPDQISGALRDEGRTYRLTWAGRTGESLAFALGLEFSVPAGDVLLGQVGSFGVGLSSIRLDRGPDC